MRIKSIFGLLSLILVATAAWVWFTQTWYSNNQENELITFQTPISDEAFNKYLETAIGVKVYPSIAKLAKWRGLKLNLEGTTSLVIQPKTSFWNLIRLLVRFQREQQLVTINSNWDLETLDTKMSEKFSWEKGGLKRFLSDEETYKQWNEMTFSEGEIHSLSWQALFIPNSYLFKRKTTIESFMDKMSKSAHDFWTKERMLAAHRINLTPVDVVKLASIVTKESNFTGEYGKIASTYKNRLAKGMLLQADPTVVFARGRAGRVLNRDTKIESPFNTYLYTGLPIGALCIPNLNAVDSCLFGADYPYLYFCAKADLTPQHDFAITLEEHNKNAQRFHRALNDLKRN
jgi:UPF0755 protein